VHADTSVRAAVCGWLTAEQPAMLQASKPIRPDRAMTLRASHLRQNIETMLHLAKRVSMRKPGRLQSSSPPRFDFRSEKSFNPSQALAVNRSGVR
jgi:hypothetical protein